MSPRPPRASYAAPDSPRANRTRTASASALRGWTAPLAMLLALLTLLAIPAGAAPVRGMPGPVLSHAVLPGARSLSALPTTLTTLNLLTGTLTNGTLGYAPVANSQPIAAAYDPATGEIVATDWGSGNDTVVNVTTGLVVGNLATNAQPSAVTVDPTTGLVYTADSGTGAACPGSPRPGTGIAVGSLTNLTWFATIPDAWTPTAIVDDPASGLVFAADTCGNNVTEASAANLTVVRTVAVGTFPTAIAYDPAAQVVIVGNQNSNNVTVLNGSTGRVLANIAVGSSPDGIAYDSANGMVYVADSGGTNLTILNVTTLKTAGQVSVGFGSVDVAYDAPTGTLFMDSGALNQVTAWNPANRTFSANLSAGGHPRWMQVAGASGKLYVTDEAANELLVVAGTPPAVTASVPFQVVPVSTALDGKASVLAVASILLPGLEFVNATTEQRLHWVGLGTAPNAVAFDAANGLFYVSEPTTDSVSVYNPSNFSLVTQLSVPPTPVGLAYDSQNGNVYVASQGYSSSAAGNVTEINGSTNTVTASLTPRQFGVAAIGLDSIVYDPSTDRVYVGLAGATGSESALLAVDASTDTLAGTANIPRGSSISLAVDPASGDVFAYTWTSSGELTVVAPNDTLVGTSALTLLPEASGIAFDAADGAVYIVSPNSTDVAVVDPATGSILGNFGVGNGPDSVLVDPTSGAVDVTNALDGTLAIAGGISGSVGGATTYPVTFHESGLSPGSSWTVAIGTKQWTSVNSTVVVSLSNGTYSYLVSAPGAVATANGSGTFTITGAAKNVLVTFGPVPGPTFPLTFVETGLAEGTSWSVALTATGSSSPTLGSSSNATVSFEVAGGFAGTFTVAAVGTMTATPSSGSVSMPLRGPFTAVAVRFASTPAPPTITSFSPSATSVPLGTAVAFTLVVDNGTAPLTYAYTGLPTGCLSANVPDLSCVPTTVGTSHTEVRVTDANGHSATANATVQVVPLVSTGPGPTPAASPLPLIALGVVGGIVVGGLVGYVIARRRSNGSP